MKKQNLQQLPLEEMNKPIWEDSALVTWLLLYGRFLAGGILVALVLSLVIYRLFSTSNTQTEKDYIEADRVFQTFVQNPKENSDPLASKEALNDLQNIMQRHPELHAKYDGLIAQILVNRNSTDSAIEYAAMALARTSSESLPFYGEYSKNTLLIGERNYQEALKRSRTLEQQMNEQIQTKNHSFGDTLFAFNLLRIALLQQQLHKTEEELNSWIQWEKFVSNSRDLNLAQAVQTFTIGDIALKDYIKIRKTLGSVQ